MTELHNQPETDFCSGSSSSFSFKVPLNERAGPSHRYPHLTSTVIYYSHEQDYVNTCRQTEGGGLLLTPSADPR